MREDAKGKLLIVDDEPETLELVEDIFEDTEIETKTLTSGAQLHEVLREFKPDILLLDRMMPGKTGIALCKEIRMYDLNTIIIFFSSLSDFDHQEEGYAVGAQDYIPKPFSMELLEKKIEEWLIIINHHKALETRLAFTLMIGQRVDCALECVRTVLNQADLPESLRLQQEEAISWLEGIKKFYTVLSNQKNPGSNVTPNDIIINKSK
ncbi:response regulator [Deltaproteobacteria bacterium TL4]